MVNDWTLAELEAARNRQNCPDPKLDPDGKRRNGELCWWCDNTPIYSVNRGQGDTEYACEEHKMCLREGRGPTRQQLLDKAMTEIVAEYGLKAVYDWIHKAVDYRLETKQ